MGKERAATSHCLSRRQEWGHLQEGGYKTAGSPGTSKSPVSFASTRPTLQKATDNSRDGETQGYGVMQCHAAGSGRTAPMVGLAPGCPAGASPALPLPLCATPRASPSCVPAAPPAWWQEPAPRAPSVLMGATSSVGAGCLRGCLPAATRSHIPRVSEHVYTRSCYKQHLRLITEEAGEKSYFSLCSPRLFSRAFGNGWRG